MKKRFFEQGYLLLRSVLSEAETIGLNTHADDLREQHREGDLLPQNAEGTSLKLMRLVEHSSQFDFLIDHKAVFPMLRELMGPFFQVMGTELFFRDPSEALNVSWHTDGGPFLGRFRLHAENPILILKAQFFLTDQEEENMGNFMMVPGSHLWPVPPEGIPRDLNHAEAVQLRVKAGDVLLFPWSLWHAVSPNHSRRPRKSITLRYGQAWCRPYDYAQAPVELLDRFTPRQKMLFGYLGEATPTWEYFYPDTEHVLNTLQASKSQ